MKEFPKTFLALSFFNLIPIFLSVFFLFGGVHVFGRSSNTWITLLFYILNNLFWVLPIASFFIGLNEYRRGYTWRSLLVLLVGAGITLFDIIYLFVL